MAIGLGFGLNVCSLQFRAKGMLIYFTLLLCLPALQVQVVPRNPIPEILHQKYPRSERLARINPEYLGALCHKACDLKLGKLATLC